MSRVKVGIDIGGTFTDLVAYDQVRKKIFGKKILTTPKNPVSCFMDILKIGDLDISNIDVLIHATTLGTNMFLGQAGLELPRILLITNRGFKDIIEIGRQNRSELYNLFFKKPKPLVPRRYRIEVKGRINAEGIEIEKLDEREVVNKVRKYCKEIDVYVISFLHSYINPIHEITVKNIIGHECPDKVIIASYEVDPQPKEFERTSTTIINGLLKPMFSRYLNHILEKLVENNFKGKLLVMRSDGGMSDINLVIKKPAVFLESGPAAGTVAVAYLSKQLNIDMSLSFDMGGTTAKASAVINGDPQIVSEYEVAGEMHFGRSVRGSGYPLRIPHIDLAEVSAGGGTVVWVDEGGGLRIGPESMGSDPGPACYGRGGTEPTITDANLILGRLPDRLGEDGIILNKELALDALKKVSDNLGIDVFEAAFSIISLSNYVMGRAIRLVSLEKGYDPRNFVLFAFGGAGPLHAPDLMDIGFREIVVPIMPGLFSAFGLLVTDYKHNYVKSIVEKAGNLEDGYLGDLFEKLVEKAITDLKDVGVSNNRVLFMKFLDMRYVGQGYHLRVPYDGNLFNSISLFHEKHKLRYGYSMIDHEVEVNVIRLFVRGIVDKPVLKKYRYRSHLPRPIGFRDVYFEEEGWTKTKIFSRLKLKAGALITGPAIVEEFDSTILIPPSFKAVVDEYLNIRISWGD